MILLPVMLSQQANRHLHLNEIRIGQGNVSHVLRTSMSWSRVNPSPAGDAVGREVLALAASTDC